MTWIGPEQLGRERAQVEAQLTNLPGGQLVIVRYGGNHYPFDESVYNQPDIDHSKVIWARERICRESGNDLVLLGHKVWLAEPGAIPARISPYPMTESVRQHRATKSIIVFGRA